MFIIPFYHQDLQNMSVTICLSPLFTSIVKTDKKLSKQYNTVFKKVDGDKTWGLVYFHVHPFPWAFFTSFKKIQITSIIQTSRELRGK